MSKIQDVSKDNTAVLITAAFPDLSPQQLFDAFTQPKILTTWWSQQAQTDVVEGGAYEISWPAMNWTLRGNYTAVSPPSTLAFTWNWDHQPDLPQRNVVLTIEPDEVGSLLQIEHGHYTDSEVDQEDRQSHIDGWLHFLSVLHNVSALNAFKTRINTSQSAFLDFLKSDKEALYQKADSEGWTPATILAHIGDGRSFYAGEVKRLSAEQGGAFGRPLTDLSRLETIEKANTRTLPELETSIQDSYAKVSKALDSLEPSHLAFECQHPAYGRYTLEEIIRRFLVGHDQMHVNQIRDILDG